MFFLAMCINLDSQFSGTCPRVRYATPVAPRDVSKCGLAEAQRRAHDAPMANVDARKCSRRRHLRASNSNSQGIVSSTRKGYILFRRKKIPVVLFFLERIFARVLQALQAYAPAEETQLGNLGRLKTLLFCIFNKFSHFLCF